MKASIAAKIKMKQYYRRHKKRLIKAAMLRNKSNPQYNLKYIRAWQKVHPEQAAFRAAYARCNNPKNPGYKYYGGRGIQFLLTSWRELINLIGKRPNSLYSLDRIDNNGNYAIGNIRWATKKQQMNNRGSYASTL